MRDDIPPEIPDNTAGETPDEALEAGAEESPLEPPDAAAEETPPLPPEVPSEDEPPAEPQAEVPPDRPEPAPTPMLSDKQHGRHINKGVAVMLILFLAAIGGLVWALGGLLESALVELGFVDPPGSTPATSITRTTTPTTMRRPPATVREATPTTLRRSSPSTTLRAASASAVDQRLKEMRKHMVGLRMKLQAQTNDRKTRDRLVSAGMAYIIEVGRLYHQGRLDEAASSLKALEKLVGQHAISLGLGGSVTPYAVKRRIIKTSDGHKVWMISGKVTNDEPGPVRAIVVRAVLKDAGGRVINTGVGIAGNSLAPLSLEKNPYKVLQAKLLRTPTLKIIKPGHPVQFTIILPAPTDPAAKMRVTPFLSPART